MEPMPKYFPPLVVLSILSFSLVSHGAGDPTVRVRLERGLGQFVVEGISLSFQQERALKASLPPMGRRRLEISRVGKPGRWRVRENSGGESWVESSALQLRGEDLAWRGRTYPSRLVLSAQGDRIDVVGVLPLKDYIAGVVAGEMPLEWPVETLKAQAIAARSYAMAVREERKNRRWDLESTIDDQVYRHVFHGDPKMANVEKAVKETEGIFLLAPKGKILKAYYHADCGGQTASAKNVWGTGPDMGQATDESCPLSQRAKWTLKLKKGEVRKRLSLSPDVAISSMEVVRLHPGQRIQEVVLRFADGLLRRVKATDFRLKVGPGDLKSTWFDVGSAGDDFVFRGQGFGHGVGLCQWGSRALGAKGVSSTEILKHYYPLAQLGSAVTSL